jgi:hypothetical protein
MEGSEGDVCMTEVVQRFTPLGQLIIGLGSQASRIVDEVKGFLESSPFGGTISSKFLAIDTTDSVLNSLRHVDKDDRILITKPTATTLYGTAEWCPAKYLDVVAGGTGFGRYRVGAPALLCAGVSEQIRPKISEIVAKFRTGGITNIGVSYIVCAGGGTGSGLLPHIIDMVSRSVFEITQTPPVSVILLILPLQRDPREDRVNAYALIKELSVMQNRLGKNIPLVILLEREVAGVSKDFELKKIIANFLIDFSFVAPTKGAGPVFDVGDFEAFVGESIKKNLFAILGAHIVRFPITELNWYYMAERFIDEKEKELLLLEWKLEDEEKTQDELNRELEALKKEYEREVIKDKKLAERIKEKTDMAKEMTLGELIKTKERQIKELNRIEERYNKLNKKVLGASLSSNLQNISLRLDKLRKDFEDIINLIDGANSALSEVRSNKGIGKTKNKLEEVKRTLREAYNYLRNPPSEIHDVVIRLTDEDIERLREKTTGEGIISISDHCFKELMVFLNREEEYKSFTVRPIMEGRIMLDLLANYLFDPEHRQALEERLANLREEQRERLRTYLKQKIARVLISSNELNIEKTFSFPTASFEKAYNIESSGLRQFLIPESWPVRRFTFINYVLIGGLSLVLPTKTKKLPSSLPTLDRLAEDYYGTSKEEIIIRHSYLLPTVPERSHWFDEAKNLIPDCAGVEDVLTYLRSYPIEGIEGVSFDAETSLMTLNTSLNDALRALKKDIQALEQRVESIKIPEKFSSFALSILKDSLVESVDKLTAINGLLENCSTQLMRWNEESLSLIHSLQAIKSSLDKPSAEKLWNILTKPIEECQTLIRDLKNVFLPSMESMLQKLANIIMSDDYIKFRDSIPEELPFRDRTNLNQVDEQTQKIRSIQSSIKINVESLYDVCEKTESVLKDISKILLT